MGLPQLADDPRGKIPTAAGDARPAEWEPHEATWIAWPHNRHDWPGKLSPIPWVYAEIVRRLAASEPVRILVGTEAQQRRARRLLKRVGADLGRVEFHMAPTDRSWARDYGLFFVRRPRPEPRLAISRFRFNAWASYGNWHLDDAVPDTIARWLGLPVFRAQRAGRDVVLEGGSIDVNGAGTLITTEECLLDQSVQVRNPGLDRRDMEQVLKDYLGATQLLWLGRGIAGDDTHGHVDDLCRFVNRTTLVLCQETEPADANYAPLQENRERLQRMRLEDGSGVEVVPLPMPAPLLLDGRRLPASYANFYIANDIVLVPTFNDPQDRRALGILADLFPGRAAVGIHAVDLVWGLGTLHCLTHQQPAAFD